MAALTPHLVDGKTLDSLLICLYSLTCVDRLRDNVIFTLGDLKQQMVIIEAMLASTIGCGIAMWQCC